MSRTIRRLIYLAEYVAAVIALGELTTLPPWTGYILPTAVFAAAIWWF
jgi:hypothetical protein